VICMVQCSAALVLSVARCWQCVGAAAC
jgi:hypothetical protein